MRTRFTLVQGALVLMAGIALLGMTYVLMSQSLPPNTPQKFLGGGNPVASSTATSLATNADGIVPSPHTLLTGASINTRDSALSSLLTQGAIALGATAVAATALAWLTVGRLLQPLQRMTETARRIAQAPAADRGLHERIALDGPADEIKELGDTFDVMLARLDQSFDGQRRFIANASHELRTPLALNQALIEVVLERPDASPETRQLGETLLGINKRHERLIDGLLLLARSERDLDDHAFVDLADVVEHVVDQVPDTSPVVVTAEGGEAPTTGNSVLLERLVQNLVENGVRYNVPEGGWVRVTSGSGDDGSWVRVTNTGPLVPRYEVPSLFEPFRRLGTERIVAAGAGLGLSIVQAVARAHGGGVRAEPRDGGGLEVTVTLPRAPDW